MNRKAAVVGLPALVLLVALLCYGPKSPATAADMALPAQAVPDVQPGENVRLCLDRARSGAVAWVGGVVKSADATHITVIATIFDPVPVDGGGTVSVSRRVEQWVPMTSILYVEKMIDGKPADQVP